MSVITESGVASRFDHRHCLLCGDLNPLSLKLDFVADESGVSARFVGNVALQGYDGMLHGGVIASLLDSAMTHCLFHQGIRAVTGQLKIDYMRPVPFDAVLMISASVERATPPLYIMRSEIHHNGQCLARASAKFMQKETTNAD